MRAIRSAAIVASVLFATSAAIAEPRVIEPGNEATVHITGPVLPGAGMLQDQPAGTVSDWNTVCAGTAVVSDTLAAGRSSSVGLNVAVSVSALFLTVIV